MSTTTLVAVGALSLLILLLFGATMELHRQVLQLRMYIGFVDTTQPVPFNDDFVAPEDLFRAAPASPNPDAHRALLVLSDGCVTCSDVARRLPAKLPANLSILLLSHSEEDAATWLLSYGHTLGPQIRSDVDRSVSTDLGIAATPVFVRFAGRRPVAATTLPSGRQFEKELRWLARNGRVDRYDVLKGAGT